MQNLVRGLYRRSCRVALGSSLCLCCVGQGIAAIQFEDVSATAGPFPVTESWGVTATDINGDGWTDIFYNAHRQRPYVFRNEGSGQFTDVTLRVDRSSSWIEFAGDQHAGTWADFDNDGDKDLLVATGINVDAQFFVNQGGYFLDEASAYGLAGDGAGRGAFWADFSGDGYADLLTTTFNPTKELAQAPSLMTFQRQSAAGFSCGPRNNHIHVNDFNVDGKADVLCMRESSRDKLWDISDYALSGGAFVDISAAMPASALIADSAAADFTGNLQTDLLIVRGNLRLTEAHLAGPDRIEVRVGGSDEGSSAVANTAFQFVGGDRIQFDISSEQFGRWTTFIGAGKVRPTEDGPFTLDNSDPTVWGQGTFDPVFGKSIYINYDTTLNEWQVRLFWGVDGGRAYFMIDRLSGSGFGNLRLTGRTNGDNALSPHLLVNNDGAFSNQAGARGIGSAVRCAGAGVGDFDNDMDVDVYMVCRGGAQNLPNRLYINDGTGRFTLVPNAGGAEGPVGAAVADGAGTGDSVTVADFDNDGFLDLFVVNGLNLQPSRLGGPAKLYRNAGNPNKWLQLDLDGTSSNRDGLGAKVFVTTADGKTQLREQDGGYHRWSQNDQRLHFGLGANSLITRLRVEWPGVGGQVNVNEFYNINVGTGQRYRVTEGTAGIISGRLVRLTPGAALGDVAPSPGDECGETAASNPKPLQEPWYHNDYGPALLLWKDCSTSMWHVRVKGGKSQTTLRYKGRLVSSAPFSSMSGFSLESTDSLSLLTPNEAAFTLNVRGVLEDGFDFTVPSGVQCLELESPAGELILVGAGRWAAKAPLNLQTMQPCTGAEVPSVGIAGVQVDETAGSVSVPVTLSKAPAAGQTVTVNFATANGTATAGRDYVAKSGTLSFSAGQTSKTIAVTILDDALLEGPETFAVTLGAVTGGLPGNTSATVTINDDEGVACGAPAYSAGSEPGMFVWRDCAAHGTSQKWFFRVTAGGSGTVQRYDGTITSTPAPTAAGFSIEGADVLSVIGDTVTYSLGVKGAAQDGIDVMVPNGAATCVAASRLPEGALVRVGAGRIPVSLPFSLSDLGVCR
jgi:hypothetical protein